MASRPVHPSMQRLLDAAGEATAGSRSPVRAWPDLLRRMDVTAQAFNNWKRRGISEAGAIQAAALFGVDAQWLLTGAHGLAGGRKNSAAVEEPAPTYVTDAELLKRLGELLARVPEGMRTSFGEVLGGWARSGGHDAQHRVAALLALLAASGKRQAAA